MIRWTRLAPTNAGAESGTVWWLGTIRTFAAGRATEVLRELCAWDRTAEPSERRYLLLGDVHHADQLYDVTEAIHKAVTAPLRPESVDLGARLRGRTLLRLERHPESSATLWSLREQTVRDVGPNGLLLDARWLPRPRADRLPAVGALPEPTPLGWWFLDGPPSRRVRGERLEALHRAAEETLRRLSKMGSVGIAAGRWPEWWTPSRLAAAGGWIVLEEDASPWLAWELLSVPDAWGRVAVVDPESSPPWGKLLGATAEGRIGSRLELVSPITHLVPRGDWWARLWDRSAQQEAATTVALLDRLRRSGWTPRIQDERTFAEQGLESTTRAVLIGPCRELPEPIVRRLEEHRSAGGWLLFVEPAPEVVLEGSTESSERLRRLYAGRRTVLWDPERPDAFSVLNRFLRRAGSERPASLFDRKEGSLLPEPALLLREPHGGELLLLQAPSTKPILIERNALRRPLRVTPTGWSPQPHRWANGRTYWDWTPVPDQPELFRLLPVARPRS